MKRIKLLANELRSWADHPAPNGYTKVGPNVLRDVADLLDPPMTNDLVVTDLIPMTKANQVVAMHFNRPINRLELNSVHRHLLQLRGLRQLDDLPDAEAAFYRVRIDDWKSDGCVHCNAGAFWTIVYIVGEEERGIGQSWGDQELAQDICDLMNMAREDALDEKAKAVRARA